MFVAAFARNARSLIALTTIVFLGTASDAPATDAPPVDVALVLAVDASGSVNSRDHEMQRRGYADAITHPAFLHAIRSGRHGRIAMAYLEWASSGRHHLVVPMTVISSAADAERFARHVEAARQNRLGYTAMGAALGAAEQLLVESPFPADREIIDVSANGKSNRGPAPHLVRDRLVAAGITINGLPMVTDKTHLDAAHLERYFADCVIGGAGAFSLPVTDRASFVQTLLAKMVHEIAGLIPPAPPRLIPAAAGSDCWLSENDD